MQRIGLIAEYNPIHNGHIYQIKEIKRLYPDSIIILLQIHISLKEVIFL